MKEITGDLNYKLPGYMELKEKWIKNQSKKWAFLIKDYYLYYVFCISLVAIFFIILIVMLYKKDSPKKNQGNDKSSKKIIVLHRKCLKKDDTQYLNV